MFRITDKIFLSGLHDACSEAFVNGNGITAILNVSEYPTNPCVMGVWCPLLDNAGTSVNDLVYAVGALRNLIDQGNVVLVHCMAGVSRSPTVVATYLAQEWKCTWRQAILHVKSCRPIVHPNDALVGRAKEVLGE